MKDYLSRFWRRLAQLTHIPLHQMAHLLFIYTPPLPVSVAASATHVLAAHLPLPRGPALARASLATMESPSGGCEFCSPGCSRQLLGS
jgi:hypothetical protein